MTPQHTHPRKMKIIATVGPAQRDENGQPDLEELEKLVKVGVDIFRLNMSHGTHDEQRAMGEAIHAIKKKDGCSHIKIVADMQGPKHRIGTFEENPDTGENNIFLSADDIIRFDTSTTPGYKDERGTRVSLPDADVIKALEVGKEISLADGLVSVKITRTGTDETGPFVEARLLSGRELSNNKGFNLPDTFLDIAALTEKDLNDIPVAIEIEVDMIWLSFVQSADQLVEARQILHAYDSDTIIEVGAKIEKPAAVINIDSIAEEADCVVFARGDMALEGDQEDLPGYKEHLLDACHKHKTPIYVATQVMASMKNHPRESRAETCSIWRHAEEGFDGVMGSDEIAVGEYPLATVTRMDTIIRRSEFRQRDPEGYRQNISSKLKARFSSASSSDADVPTPQIKAPTGNSSSTSHRPNAISGWGRGL